MDDFLVFGESYGGEHLAEEEQPLALDNGRNARVHGRVQRVLLQIQRLRSRAPVFQCLGPEGDDLLDGRRLRNLMQCSSGPGRAMSSYGCLIQRAASTNSMGVYGIPTVMPLRTSFVQ